MGFLLGNLSIPEIEKRIGIEFPEETRKYMKERHQDNANNLKKGFWHCFDIPFTLVCADRETAQTIYNSVKDRASEIKEQLQISIQT